MQGTAQQWLVLQLTSDPLALGIVGALQFGPLLFLAPFGGIIADRWPRRRVLVATQAAAAILAAILWALTATGAVQLWHVFVLATLLGFVNAVDMPTRQSFISEMVPPDHLINAVSLNSAQFNVSRILGPGVGGALIWLLGIPLLFLLNALSFLAVIAGLLMMRQADLVPMPRAKMGRGLRQVRALGEGVRFIAATPAVALTLLLVAVIGTFGFNFNVLLPLEAHSVLSAGPQVFGLVSSSLGVGALLGALLIARRRGVPSGRTLVATAAIFGTLEAGVALTTPGLLGGLAASLGLTDLAALAGRADYTLLAMGLIALTGMFMSTFSAAANTRTQLSSPPELRGRVMSVYMMLFAGTTPIGNLLISAIAGTPGGVPLAWAVAGLPCVAIALVGAWLMRRSPAAEKRPEVRPVTPALAGRIDAAKGALPEVAELAD